MGGGWEQSCFFVSWWGLLLFKCVCVCVVDDLIACLCCFSFVSCFPEGAAHCQSVMVVIMVGFLTVDAGVLFWVGALSVGVCCAGAVGADGYFRCGEVFCGVFFYLVAF